MRTGDHRVAPTAGVTARSAVLRVGLGGHVARRAFAGDGDQGQTHVTNLGEQPVQRCLVGDVTLEERGPVCVVGECQPAEPGAPPLVEVALDSDPAHVVLSPRR